MPGNRMEADGGRYGDRHTATQHLMNWLRPNPRLDGVAMDVAQIIWVSAQSLVDILGDGPELSAGLRKLREAKDCCVIQALEDARAQEHIEPGDNAPGGN